MIIIYFYLRSISGTWPYGARAPDLLWGSLNALVTLASAIPNTLLDKAAIDQDLRRVRRGLVILSAIGVVLLVIRGIEFTALNVTMTESAYGSIVWVLLVLHTFNLITDVVESFVLTALMFKEPLEGKRFVDVAESCGYWDFVVVTWLPIYAVIYWAPRF